MGCEHALVQVIGQLIQKLIYQFSPFFFLVVFSDAIFESYESMTFISRNISMFHFLLFFFFSYSFDGIIKYIDLCNVHL